MGGGGALEIMSAIFRVFDGGGEGAEAGLIKVSVTSTVVVWDGKVIHGLHQLAALHPPL